MNEEIIGKLCKLTFPIRDHEGRTRFMEHPKILRQFQNLDRTMYLVQFEDGKTTFCFPDEVEIL